MNMDVGIDAPCEKSWKQRNPLSNTITDTSTIMRNRLYYRAVVETFLARTVHVNFLSKDTCSEAILPMIATNTAINEEERY